MCVCVCVDDVFHLYRTTRSFLTDTEQTPGFSSWGRAGGGGGGGWGC